jgi:hypothetical protein
MCLSGSETVGVPKVARERPRLQAWITRIAWRLRGGDYRPVAPSGSCIAATSVAMKRRFVAIDRTTVANVEPSRA